MRKLNLTKERYIITQRIFPETNKSATYIYPEILKDNLILNNNMSEHTIELFDEYFKLQNKLDIHQKVLNDCFFDSEKVMIEKAIINTHDNISYKKAQINEDISPFCWDIYKDADMYSDEIDHYVKDDYILILKYKKEEPDK